MPNVLISIDKFNEYAPHTIEVIDIVDELLSEGWQIDLITSAAGGRLLPVIEHFKATGRFLLITEAQGDVAACYDIIWIARGFFGNKLLQALQQQRVQGALIFRHYSDYNDLYIPYGVQLENQLASLTLALSTATRDRLLQTGVDAAQLKLLPWAAPARFCEWKPTRALHTPERLLYIASEMTAEMYEIQHRLADSGIQLVWLNTSEQTESLEPALFDQYDAIIANEGWVPKVLAMGIPLFFVRDGYVEGYLGEDNLSRHETDHFCGLTLRSCPDAEEWLELITDGFASAAQWTRQNASCFAEKWNLKHLLTALLNDIHTKKAYSLNEKASYALSFHSKALIAEQAQQYSLSRWLDDRRISDTRREVLLHFVRTAGDKGSISVAIVDHNEDNAASQRTLASVTSQSLAPHSVDIIVGAAWADALNTLFAESNADAILVIPAGFSLQDDALLRFAEKRIRQEDALVLYCDEMTRREDGEPEIALRPGVNIDLLRSLPYIGQTLLFSRAAALQAGGLNMHFAYASLIDLLWRFVEVQGIAALAHVSEVLVESPYSATCWRESPDVARECHEAVLAHLHRLNINATFEQGLTPEIKRVRYHWDVAPLVSIIIPTRDHVALLKRCIESLMEKTLYQRYELLIIDNQSVDEEACRFLNDLAGLGIDQIRIIRDDQPFNFAGINNRAVMQARGDVLLFLNNDCEIVDAEWLDALLEQALRPEIALVGARLEYQDGRIQHGGYLLGVQNGVATAWDGASCDSNGFQYYLKAPHNLAAVSASCMMVRKSVFIELNGFTEEHYPLYFADVDLGLRAQERGYLNIWTPYARVKHMGGATRLLKNRFQIQERPILEDYSTLRRQWKNNLLAEPSYHPAMQKMGKLFTLGENLARFHEALPGRPLPVVMAHHVNWTGCGHYRVMQPFKAMERHLMLEGGLLNTIPGVMEAAQVQPDIILLELITGSRFPDIIRQLREVCDAKIVVEYDDYLLNVPLKNGNRRHFPQRMLKNFRKVLESADWVVVSTAPLAEAYSRFHSDIRIAQNRLAPNLWGHLISERNTGKKIRIGWAGGSSHTGDLEILLPLIKALEGQVDWVFMGMKPRDVACEFHPGVPFDMYPEKLASLNLDLALVPLEINQFNECKSNLRLLELGTCGVPIIATNIEPYRCGLPVTLVENRFKDWMAAIQSYIYDPQERMQQGDALRAAIHQQWYLQDNGLDDWQHAWLAGC
ncbi:glycosyltransferase [Pseudescherichia sp.]|uniref:glycosyltransferase n=1 Tax=Pseudescherichia sp. TaxID=2055881 RepID=UPI0028AA1077|nr:glycosyltransferase [Pseudescherichia sp.]